MKALYLMAFVGFFACTPSKTVEVRQPGQQIPPPSRPIPPPVNPGELPDTMGLEIVEDQILLDLNTLSDNDRLNARYLVTCNFYNEGGQDLAIARQGVNKGINSISTENNIERAETIGVGDCLQRIDLADYGLTFREWNAIGSNLLLRFVTQSVRGEQIQFLTQSLQPYVFASDFFTTTLGADQLTAGNGLYYALIEQPIGLLAFYDSIGVDLQAEFDNEDATLSAFSQSGIALGKTRSVQIVEADDLYLVSSYDSSLAQQDSHFVNPFPVEAAIANGVLRSNKVFGNAQQFFAQEHIGFLPNGMLFFRLNGFNGNAETAAPNNVVINLNSAAIGLDPTIFIGSCHECHTLPMIQFKDQLGPHIASQGAFNALEKELGEVFFDGTKTEGRLRTINTQFARNLEQLGQTNTAKDSVTEALITPLRSEMTGPQICGYLLIDLDLCLAKIAGSDKSSQIFGNVLAGGTVSLGTLSQNFNQLVVDTGAFQ